jgi:phosphatidylinositol phospholipase C beta
MAQYFVDVFRESLIIEPLKTHPCEVNYPLPSPNDLKYKILIKNKKLQPNAASKVNNENVHTLHRKPATILAKTSSDQSTDLSIISSSSGQSSHDSSSDDSIRRKQAIIAQISSVNNPRHGVLISDDDFTDEDTPFNEINSLAVQSSNNNNTLRESKATKAMSDLVHYVVPVRFTTFALAEERNRSFEMSSFSEDKAQSAIRDHAKDFLVYNQRQLSRIYPRGTRLESSNYHPYSFWTIGCQMVALNYQTLGKINKPYLCILNN